VDTEDDPRLERRRRFLSGYIKVSVVGVVLTIAAVVALIVLIAST
jgi:hypothetical protein